MLSRLFIAAVWSLGSCLWCFLWFCYFPFGILRQVCTWLYRFLILAVFHTFITLYGCDHHLGDVTRTIWANLYHPILRSFHVRVQFAHWFKRRKCWLNGRSDDESYWYTISSVMSIRLKWDNKSSIMCGSSNFVYSFMIFQGGSGPPAPSGSAHVLTLTWERSCSVVDCLTRDRRAAGLSLTDVTALWSLSKTHLS